MILGFDRAIYQNWADHFGCPAAVLQQEGVTLRHVEHYAGDSLIVLWHIGRRTLVQCDPRLAQPLAALVDGWPASQRLSVETFREAWGDAAIRSHDLGLVHYLYPPDLPGFAPQPPFILRRLTLADGGQMSALHGANTPEDVDEGFVEVDHLVAFSCFAGDQLVAASSGYEQTGFLDIGVLVHPGYRRHGLGGAVVAAVCRWSIDHEMIAQYRHNVQNAASAGVARTLRFRQYFSSESVWLNRSIQAGPL